MSKLKEISPQLYSFHSRDEIEELLVRQLSQFFLINSEEKDIMKKGLTKVLERLTMNFSSVDHKYFKKEELTYFNPYHSGQYLAFIYFFSFHVSKHQHEDLADKMYFLNKILNSIDIYHKVELPDTFFFEHPLGTVLGRASYGEHFFAMQGCTIGGTDRGYPTIGKGLCLYSNSKIIGNCKIGDNVIMSANSYVKDIDIPDNTIVFGQFPNHTLKTNKRNKSFFKTK